jgi:CRP/FNR family transcriptional regulator, cyclic AMP receptor protein
VNESDNPYIQAATTIRDNGMAAKRSMDVIQHIDNPVAISDDMVFRLVALSSALGQIFRGRFCDTVLPNRAARTFEKDEILYELGDRERTFFFIRHGVVKTGTTTDRGREIIYHLRKDGNVVGELCAMEAVRRERAVALERTEAVPVSLDEVVDTLAQHPVLLRDFIGIFCSALSEAYDQVNRMAAGNVMHGLVKVLRGLADKLGHPSGDLVEIAAYLTQEELSEMVVARRERVSTALNSLRRRGIVQYSARAHLLLDMHALETYAA